jgi:hypothetical protein
MNRYVASALGLRYHGGATKEGPRVHPTPRAGTPQLTGKGSLMAHICTVPRPSNHASPLLYHAENTRLLVMGGHVHA